MGDDEKYGGASQDCGTGAQPAPSPMHAVGGAEHRSHTVCMAGEIGAQTGAVVDQALFLKRQGYWVA